MEQSQHLIMGKLKGSDEYFIMNPLTGQADIMTVSQAEAFRSGEYTNRDELISKGYLVEPKEEERLYRKAYLDFVDARDKDEIQIFYVPTYACNFSCSYCYQSGYEQQEVTYTPEVIDAFFNYVDREFAGRDKYITVFGGEPLLISHKARANVEYLISQATARSLGLAFVTNGYTLEQYIPAFDGASIREIQVTLDGVGAIHDKRRMLKGGQGSFPQIVCGIDKALAAGIPINLRVVLDRENMPHLYELADFARKKGWTDHPLFKTQLGRNYELHTCQANQNKLYDRIDLYEDVYQMIQEHPDFLEFHRPAYSLSRFLFEQGELSDPLFDACPACKTEWAFDYTGSIYSCTATVGKHGERLGTFFPEVTRTEEIIEQWEERDVTTIPECTACPLRLACGGGCGSAAKNATGRIHAPDCRPIKELLGMGLSLYFNELQNDSDISTAE